MGSKGPGGSRWNPVLGGYPPVQSLFPHGFTGRFHDSRCPTSWSRGLITHARDAAMERCPCVVRTVIEGRSGQRHGVVGARRDGAGRRLRRQWSTRERSLRSNWAVTRPAISSRTAGVGSGCSSRVLVQRSAMHAVRRGDGVERPHRSSRSRRPATYIRACPWPSLRLGGSYAMAPRRPFFTEQRERSQSN